jgi:hypothetical protein
METNSSNQPPWHGDAFQGQGGSYVFDPKTGKRTLVERTEIPEPQSERNAPTAPAAADADV